MGLYDTLFSQYGLVCGQVLVTEADFSNKARLDRMRSTLQTMLRMGAVPVMNENDVLAMPDRRKLFKDNDSLAVLIALELRAQLLLLLSDVAGVSATGPPPGLERPTSSASSPATRRSTTASSRRAAAAAWRRRSRRHTTPSSAHGRRRRRDRTRASSRSRRCGSSPASRSARLCSAETTRWLDQVAAVYVVVQARPHGGGEACSGGARRALRPEAELEAELRRARAR